MNKTLSTLLITGSLLLSTPLLARDISVEVTNLTNAAYFTPLLIAAHSRQTHLFEVGSKASLSLQAMAEGGDTSGLIAEIEAAGGEYVDNPAGDLLAPGKSTLADAALNKPTFPSILGLENSRKIARELRDEAIFHLQHIDGQTETLAWLADYVISRDR